MRRRFDQPALRNHCRPLRGESAGQVYIFANKTKDNERSSRFVAECAQIMYKLISCSGMLSIDDFIGQDFIAKFLRALGPSNKWLKVIENHEDHLMDWNLPCAFPQEF